MEKIFKAKRLDNGEWVEFDLFDGVSAITWDIFDRNTVCQYTGINDSQGNRIFAGDELAHWIDGFKSAFFARWDSEDACYDGDCSAWRWRDLKLTGHNIHDRG